jgi:hypothetical protein
MLTRAGKARCETSTPSSSSLSFYTGKEAARELRISLAKLDRVIARGELKAKKHGHSVMTREIKHYIEQWPDVKPRAERGAVT